jgi:hypothetical protein
VAVLKAKPEKVVAFYLGLLERELIGPSVVTRANSDDFKGAKDDTITLRIGGLRAVARDYEWRTRNAPIQLDDISGGDGITVKLDTHVYSATGLTDEHRTLDDISFAEEVIKPQVDAVVDRFEGKVVAGLRNADVKHTVPITADTDPHLAALEAYRLMNSEKVAPTGGRVYMIGTDVAAAWLASDRLTRYDSVGVSGTPALREATIGQLSGSPVIVNTALEPDEAYYLHKTGLVLGNVAPLVPEGATTGRTGISKNGYAVRWIADYDSNYLRDRSIVSSFLGVNDVRDERHQVAGGSGENAYLPGDIIADDFDRDGAGAGTAKGPRNVRIVKFDFSGGGSVL